MKPFIVALILLSILNTNIFSQKTVEIWDAYPKNDNLSIQGYGVYDQLSPSSFISSLKHGATVFNTKNDLLLVDRNSYTEKNKISCPKVKMGDHILITGDKYISVKNNLLCFSKKMNARATALDLYAIKIGENLTVSETPEKLFQMLSDEWALSFQVNESQDLLLFVDEYEKKEKKTIYCRLYDNNLKLLKVDSTKGNSKDDYTVVTFITDNGFAVINQNNLKREVKLYNITNNETINFSIDNKEKNPMISSIKQIGNKIFICGLYYSEVSKRNFTNGIFRIVYNIDKKSVEEETYFDHVPQGDAEIEQHQKFVHESCITNDGSCYVVICQGVRSQTFWEAYNSTNNFINSGLLKSSFIIYKYEIMCVTNKGEKWRKQLPSNSVGDLYTINNTAFLYCPSNDTYDANNFVYENYFSLKNNRNSLDVGNYVSYLKFDSKGDIKRLKVNHAETNPVKDSKNNWLKYESYEGALKTKEFNFSKTTLTEQ